MQKSKLGISVGLLCAALYFSYLFGNILIPVAIVAYILIVEENIWLKKSAVKSLVIYAVLSIVLPYVINLIPDVLDVVDSLLNVFNVYLRNTQVFNIIYNIFDFFNNILYIVRRFAYIILGVLSLKQATIKLPVVDNFINKYMD